MRQLSWYRLRATDELHKNQQPAYSSSSLAASSFAAYFSGTYLQSSLEDFTSPAVATCKSCIIANCFSFSACDAMLLSCVPVAEPQLAYSALRLSFLAGYPFFVFPSISIFSVPHPQPHTSQIPFSIVIYATMLACLSWRILHRCFERCRNRLGCRREFCSRVARRDRKPDRRWWDVHLLLYQVY